MSPRKRLRASPSDGLPPPPVASAATASRPVPPPAGGAVKAGGDGAATDSPMARSPAGSSAPSLAESTSSTSRYASLKDSKNRTRSWYGSWQRPKSSASTQVARETILGGTSKPSTTLDLSRFDTRKPDEDGGVDDSRDAAGPRLSRKTSSLTVGGPKANGTLSCTNGAPAGNGRSTNGSAAAPKPAPSLAGPSGAATDSASGAASEMAGEATNTAQDQGSSSALTEPAAEEASAQGWLSWIGRRGGPAAPKPADVAEDAALPAPQPPKGQEPPAPAAPVLLEPAHDEAPVAPAAEERPATASGMWTYLWHVGRGNPTQAATEAQEAKATGGAASSSACEDVVMEDAPPPSAPIPVPLPAAVASSASSTSRSAANASAPGTATASAGSTWAFWSRDSRKPGTGKSPESPAPGEIAVIGERSEAHPKPATGVKLNEQPSSKASSMKDVPIKDAAAVPSGGAGAASPAGAAAVAGSSKGTSKRLRPVSMDIDDMAAEAPALAKGGSESLPPSKQQQQQQQQQASASAASTPAKGQQTAPAKPAPPNLLLPSFRSTYRLKENPSILRQVAQLLLRTQQPPANHVFLSKDLPKIKKAVAIGVHGLFPAAYLRPMIGQPTGTSIRFANHAAESVRRWADSHGYTDCEIEKIALEGEGRIADRVENLWKLLLNWIDHIRQADLVVLACHSQGVPVGFMLLAKLIELGVVTRARIGVCAMAGVSLGPFPDYKSGLGILMGSATELWDFANPESEVSKRYEQALQTALAYGVRVTFVGSIDDQVVPLESAIYSPVHHPYVYRAVFVDGRIHAPDFLVGFACKLRNLGVSDHGLVRELSVPLAGSLYTGEGHSRLYDEPQVYDLAVAHALETADVGGPVVCTIKKHEGLTNPNPYHLPWVMRGLLEEDFVKTELHAETTELVKQFDDWKPVTKALKDVKYRLEAVRSKL